MIFPTLAPVGSLVPLEGSLSRALDVLHGLPLLLPQERLTAVSMLHQFARDRFGPEAPETRGVQGLHQDLSQNGGAITDKEALKTLFFQWRAQESAFEENAEPVTRTYTVAPLFNAGGVRFFQSPDAPVPLRRGEVPSISTLGGGYLLTNERNFHRYFDGVRDIGGVTVGLGSLQNLDLAAAAGASGLILADIAPTVTMTLALLMPQLAHCRTPEEFRNAAESLIRASDPMERFLDPIPEDYRPAFENHLTALRRSPMHTRPLRKLFMNSMLNPYSFLGSQESFERVADLAVRGGISIVYGNFFGGHMPDLVELAMQAYADPIRIVHTTNAPELIVTRNFPMSAGPLVSLLEGPRTDPDGRFLTSTELGGNVNRLPGAAAPRRQDIFRYHSVPMRAVAILLRAYGHMAPFIRRLERSEGI